MSPWQNGSFMVILVRRHGDSWDFMGCFVGMCFTPLVFILCIMCLMCTNMPIRGWVGEWGGNNVPLASCYILTSLGYHAVKSCSILNTILHISISTWVSRCKVLLHVVYYPPDIYLYVGITLYYTVSSAPFITL